MPENIPRRLRRFYRQQNNKTSSEINQTPKTNNEDDFSFTSEINSDAFNDTEKSNNSNDIERIPSMDYEDLDIDEKNLKDIKNFEKKSNEEEFVKKEVENFKKQYNRAPTTQETDKIAETLYNQLKDNPIYSNETNNKQSNEGNLEKEKGVTRREQRRQNLKKESSTPSNNTSEQNKIPQTTKNSTEAVTDIKALFEDDTKANTSESNEFNLDLESDEVPSLEESSNDAESIDDLGEINLNLDGSTCPNCKKAADKILYCPKCGTAFCKSCAKGISNNEAICPKCLTKSKI